MIDLYPRPSVCGAVPADLNDCCIRVRPSMSSEALNSSNRAG